MAAQVPISTRAAAEDIIKEIRSLFKSTATKTTDSTGLTHPRAIAITPDVILKGEDAAFVFAPSGMQIADPELLDFVSLVDLTAALARLEDSRAYFMRKRHKKLGEEIERSEKIQAALRQLREALVEPEE